jgi:hypothetical protein
VRDFLRKHDSPGDLPHPAAAGSSTRNGRLRPAAGPVQR